MFKKKTLAFIFSFLALCARILAQAPIEWERYYDTLGANYGNHVIQTSDGGYLVTGGANSSPADMDVLLMKVDSAGNVQWVKKYGGTNPDGGVAAAELPNGDFLIVAIKDLISTTNSKIWLLKTTSLGDTIWTKTITAGVGANLPYGFSLTADSGCVITGHTSAIGSGSYDALIVKCDSVGNVQWLKAYGGGGADEGRSIVQSTDGGFLISGFYEDTATFGNFDCYVIKTNSVGDSVWTKRTGGSRSDYGMSLIENPDSSIFVVGVTSSYGDTIMNDCYLYKLDKNGNFQWQKTYGDNRGNSLCTIQRCTSGGYVLFGNTQDPFTFEGHTLLIRTNDLGDSLWSQTYGVSGNQYGFYLNTTNDQGFILVGETDQYAVSGYDVYLVKTDSLGNVPLGIQNIISSPFHFSVYPNPASNNFHIFFPNDFQFNENRRIEIYSETGQLIEKKMIENNNEEIETSQWSDGIYFIQIISEEKIIYESKIIIQH